MNTRSLVSFITAFGILFQIPVAFAADAPSQDFFENAWQEAATSTNYSFSCTVSSGGAKMPTDSSLTPEQKTAVSATLQALKRYKSTVKGTFLSETKSLSTTQEKINTLGILDLVAAGQLTMDQAAQKIKKAAKKTLQVILIGNTTYYKGTKKEWKKFESPEFATQLFAGASSEPVSTPLEKSSFVYKNGWKPGSSDAAIYLGTLTAKETTSLLTSFISEELAKTQAPLPTKLFITGDGHFKKYEVKSNVTVGALSFTVKENCTMNFGKAKIKAPANATSVDATSGLNEIMELGQLL